jgi:hypothetical protein
MDLLERVKAAELALDGLISTINLSISGGANIKEKRQSY